MSNSYFPQDIFADRVATILEIISYFARIVDISNYAVFRILWSRIQDNIGEGFPFEVFRTVYRSRKFCHERCFAQTSNSSAQ